LLRKRPTWFASQKSKLVCKQKQSAFALLAVDLRQAQTFFALFSFCSPARKKSDYFFHFVLLQEKNLIIFFILFSCKKKI